MVYKLTVFVKSKDDKTNHERCYIKHYTLSLL